MADNKTIVREFLAAWSDGDARRLADYFTEDAVFQMMSREPITGREAIHEDLKNQLAWCTECAFEVKAVAEEGARVFTERLDRMKVAGTPLAIPVVGVFELDGAGKLTAWRDYFDMNTVMQQLSAAGVGGDLAADGSIPPPPED
ncbi:MAG: limonene-1,2-epoxide hydrolase family protein [Actinomycetota bacterium]